MPTLSHGHVSDIKSFKTLPESHAWPQSTTLTTTTTPNPNPIPIPILDLLDPNLVHKLAHACQAHGAFQITNHNIPLSLLSLLHSQSNLLFSLPLHHKLLVLRDPNGIAGFGTARISTFFEKKMWSEGFTIVGSPVDHARVLWPHNYQTFCDVIEEYNQRMAELSKKLVGLILSSLGLPDDFEEKPNLGRASSVLQLNSYPPCPDPDRAMGLAAHTDSCLLTVLHQSNTSGLQVLCPGDDRQPSKWITVPPVPGALVVNMGDLFQILSNGRYKSVVHRAIVNRTNHRLSAAYIYGPEPHVKIAPLKGLLGKEGPKYKAVTWTEYLGLKANNFHKALNSIILQEEEKWEVLRL